MKKFALLSEKNLFSKHGPFLFIAVSLLASIAFGLYRIALTPPQLAALRARQSVTDWNRVTEDAAAPVRLKMLLGVSGIPHGYVQTTIEHRFHCTIDPVFIDTTAFDNVKPLMMAGGDVPDVLVEPDPLPLQRDVYQGFLMELPYSVILKYAPHYVSALNETDPAGWLYSNCQGHNYGIPTFFPDFRYPSPGLWRQDWLRKVGITKTPETLSEMHEALKRFTYNDPDGNGRRDTWGMSGDVTNWWWASFADIYGAYGVTPFDWMERNGQAVWGGTLPQTKRALATLRQWYAEGLIHPDFVTDKSSEGVQNKFVSGLTGYIYYFATPDQLNIPLSAPSSLTSTVTANHPDAKVVAGAFPMGPSGQRGGRTWSGGNVIVFGRQMFRHPQAVIRVLKILDAMVTNESFYLDTHMGQRGVTWDFINPASGPAGGVKYIGRYSDNRLKKRALLQSLSSSIIFSTGGPASIVDKYTSSEVRRFNAAYRKPAWRLTDVLGKPDCLPSAAQYMADLRSHQMTVFAEIIRGDRPLSDFDAWVGNWYAQGGGQMAKEANRFLQTKQAIYRTVGVTERGAQP